MEGGETTTSLLLFTDKIYEWLDIALDWGISESEFWDMTLAELNRLLASKKRCLISQQREKATFDYVLADLIGRSIGRLYNSSNKMPEINAVYPSLFDSEEIKDKQQEKKDELSVARFKAFANSFNRRFKQKKDNEEVNRKDE